MTKICVVYSFDYEKHIIIRRQLHEYLEHGYKITLIDRPVQKGNGTGVIKRISIPHIELNLLSKFLWKFIRPIFTILPEGWVDLYWAGVFKARNIISNIYILFRVISTRADIIQCHDIFSLPAAFIAGKITRRETIYDAHELASEHGDANQGIKRYIRSIEDWLIPRVSYLVVPNKYRAEHYQQLYMLKKKPFVIHNYPPQRNIHRTNQIKEFLGFPEKIFIVLYHGAIIPDRSLENLLLSAKYYVRDAVLVIIGEQNCYYQDVLLPLYRDQGLFDRVFFIPYIDPDNIMGFVSSADVGVVIYRNTNLNNYYCASMKLYEYLLAGIPVAACDFPEPKAVTNKYGIGCLFDPDDPRAIADAVNELVGIVKESPDYFRNRIEQHNQAMDWRGELNQLLEIFKDPVNSQSPGVTL